MVRCGPLPCACRVSTFDSGPEIGAPLQNRWWLAPATPRPTLRPSSNDPSPHQGFGICLKPSAPDLASAWNSATVARPVPLMASDHTVARADDPVLASIIGNALRLRLTCLVESVERSSETRCKHYTLVVSRKSHDAVGYATTNHRRCLCPRSQNLISKLDQRHALSAKPVGDSRFDQAPSSHLSSR
jgi:hypothetical protein